MLTGHGSDELKKNAKMNIKPNYISKDLYTASQIINGTTRLHRFSRENMKMQDVKEMVEGERSHDE